MAQLLSRNGKLILHSQGTATLRSTVDGSPCCCAPPACPSSLTPTFCTDLGDPKFNHPPTTVELNWSVGSVCTNCVQVGFTRWIKLSGVPSSGSVCLTSLNSNANQFNHRGDIAVGVFGGIYSNSSCTTQVADLTRMAAQVTQTATDIQANVTVGGNEPFTPSVTGRLFLGALLGIANPHDCYEGRSFPTNSNTGTCVGGTNGLAQVASGGSASSTPCCEADI